MADGSRAELDTPTAKVALTPTEGHRRPLKTTPLTSQSAERLRQRCIDQSVRRRAILVENRRADVEAMCARIVRSEFEADDEEELDVDLMLWLEEQVLEHMANAERALYEEQQAWEEEALAALLETHLSVDENDQNAAQGASPPLEHATAAPLTEMSILSARSTAPR